ncbi:MAG: response regulator [bacterium]|nr:response regulator [bacterium]
MMAGPFKNLPPISPADKTVAVLAVSPLEEDHACLRSIFGHSNWRIFQAHGCHEAIDFLRQHHMAVLVCERDLPDGNWKNLLDSLTDLPLPPMLVVTSRNADDALWAEVLHLGAYDVLSKPFDRAEVTRIISLAWLHWKEEATRTTQKPAARTATAGTYGGVSATA